MSGDPTSTHAPAKTPFRLVRCPTCKGDSVYASTNPFRPFCSDRCKNADFGAWATESYRIDAKPTLEDDMDSSAVPDSPSDH